ncbi:unnamed protein product [Cylicocyclus nassatus]|uniref:Uncharacterized protein n=1 Tax=Cylicocyclus nassatus TaxID=53992 RepID=A0AA36GH03_CYLNA|nr:unnamed protein product [Cylicocyclus nassatus]
MGTACSVSTSTVAETLKAQEETNRTIQKAINIARKEKILKILLLGPGDSGKSTTLKQIRIIHDKGFTDDEKRQRKYIIYLNLISGMTEVIRGLSSLSLSFKNSDSKVLAEKVTKYYEEVKNSDAAELTEDVADAVGRLLEDESVQFVLLQSTDIRLEESTR